MRPRLVEEAGRCGEDTHELDELVAHHWPQLVPQADGRAVRAGRYQQLRLRPAPRDHVPHARGQRGRGEDELVARHAAPLAAAAAAAAAREIVEILVLVLAVVAAPRAPQGGVAQVQQLAHRLRLGTALAQAEAHTCEQQAMCGAGTSRGSHV